MSQPPPSRPSPPPGPFTDLDRPPLREAALAAALTGATTTGGDGGDGAWRAIEVVAETGSTNADLARRAAAGEAEGLVLVADQQNAGRGRLARAWTTPPRAAIAVSVLVRPDGVPPERLGWLPLLGGLAVVDAVRNRCGLPARLKWPNDVLVPIDGLPQAAASGAAERKLCGVLAEVVPSSIPGIGPAVILGAGINVTQTADELPVPTATSLRLAGSAVTDRDTVLRAYLRALAVRYRAFVEAAGDPRRSGIGAAYREACSTLGREVEVHLPGRDVVHGTAREVDDDGRLVVATGAGELPFAAGDVVHLR
ncbi:MAG: biotin--[acetyl-CoA-carboxylase] ligase [Kineosporiaceae bacterium]|nr:biotin--[acetyl-CoA-carboxylase] ligase [Kineosporiaceae bacterium]MBK7621315.1 biotin--[acetyl-CoA-carboxylase] ligase [Kineosporiaceae bacterium]